MPDYILDIWACGLCGALTRIELVKGEGGADITLKVSGLTRAKPWLERAVEPKDAMRETLGVLLAFLSACIEVQKWAVDSFYISADPEEVYFDRRTQSAKLVLRPARKEGLMERFGELCRGLGPMGAVVAERLEECSYEKILDEYSASELLRRWLHEEGSGQAD